jgi:hypothetical protein
MGTVLAGLAVFLLQGALARAQDTVDALEKDLQQIKQDHQEASAETLSNFMSQLQTASQSPDAALDLYEKAGGQVPDGTPVKSEYAHETPHEKEEREAQDAIMMANLAIVAQLHCGLMRYAALFVTSPDQKGLHDDWIAWLKSAPQIYLQLKDDGLKPTRELRKRAVKDSVISSALGFTSWGDKDQGNWNVNRLPELYHDEVLTPLRTTPTADTLAAWDVYISLMAASQPDQDKWNQVEAPSFQFDRGCDDYAVTPTMDKLQALHDIIKANPTHPKFDDMISRLHTLVQDYRARHPGAASPQGSTDTAAQSTNAPPADPNVKVTTVKEGDMTIITTQTNAPGSTPPAPPPTTN